jgi:hypothetical protein
MKKYRTEWKYVCNEADLARIEARVSSGLLPDEHGVNGCYSVHSLYFDDLKNSCANDTDSGISRRYKYRLRYYGSSSDRLTLEKKEKLDGRCHKKTCPISREEFDAIMQGDFSELLWQTDKAVLKEFCVRTLARGFRPAVIIDYERCAYVEPITHVRITFDRNISASADCQEFLSGDYLRRPVLPSGRHILEVKFDEILTSHFRHLVSDASLVQSAFSKYTLGRLSLRSVS